MCGAAATGGRGGGIQPPVGLGGRGVALRVGGYGDGEYDRNEAGGVSTVRPALPPLPAVMLHRSVFIMGGVGRGGDVGEGKCAGGMC